MTVAALVPGTCGELMQGTLCGILCEPSQASAGCDADLQRIVREAMPEAVGLGRSQIISGGVRWEQRVDGECIGR